MNYDNVNASKDLQNIEASILQYAKSICDEQLSYFAKNKSSGVSTYIEQLEKNAPYNKLLYDFTNSMIVSYIKANSEHSGAKIYENFRNHAQSMASEQAPDVIRYLTTGMDNGNPTCKAFESLRNMNVTDAKTYIEELEFSLACFKSRYIVADTFLKIISEPKYLNFRKYFLENYTDDQLYDFLEDRFRFLGNMLIGNN